MFNDVTQLRSRVQGPVLVPGEEGYDDECTGWNLSVRHKPAAIVVADGVSDVAAAVDFAAAAELPVAVQATGHGVTEPADGAVLIRTSRLTSVSVDSCERTARVGTGAEWEAVVEAAFEEGLAPLCGSAPDVAVGGYLSGGGLPVLGRAYGYAADHVRALEVVTADGKVRTATPDTEPDLYWAVRGGKSNFGVVTEFEIDLLEVPHIYGGGMFFDGGRSEEVLRTWLDWLFEQPDEMCSSVILLRFPDLDGVPEAVRGRFLVHLRIAYTGPAAEGEKLVAPLRQLEPETDSVESMPYTRIGEIYRDPPRPTPARIRTALLGDLDQSSIDALLDVAGPQAQLPPGGVELRHLGGALSRPARRPSAIGQRDAAFHLFMSMPAPGDKAELAKQAQKDVIEALGKWDTGRLFPGFTIGADVTGEEIQRGYRAEDFERLTQLKAVYDPNNLFRIGHNIAPAAPK